MTDGQTIILARACHGHHFFEPQRQQQNSTSTTSVWTRQRQLEHCGTFTRPFSHQHYIQKMPQTKRSRVGVKKDEVKVEKKEEESSQHGLTAKEEPSLQDVKPALRKPKVKKEEKGVIKREQPNNDQQDDNRIITLAELLQEKSMKASRDYNNAGEYIGKGPRNERELLRFYSDVGQMIEHKKKWEWKTSDPELPFVRKILDKYKDGLRAPAPRKKWDELKLARAENSSDWDDYKLE